MHFASDQVPRIEVTFVNAYLAVGALRRNVNSYHISASDDISVAESRYSRKSVATARATTTNRPHLVTFHLISKVDQTSLVRLLESRHGFLQCGPPAVPLCYRKLGFLIDAYTHVDWTIAVLQLEPAPARFKRDELCFSQNSLCLGEAQDLLLTPNRDRNRNC